MNFAVGTCGRLAILLLAMSVVSSAGAVGAQHVIRVDTTRQLQNAVAYANRSGGNTLIVLADGVYAPADTLYILAPRITLAGAPGARSRVILEGDAMSPSARVGNVIRVSGAHFELKDMTVQRSRYHLIQIAGEDGADAPVIRDCILRDAYEQMLKVSIDPARPDATSNHGLVENCIFEYSAGIGPQYYIGGIDAHGAKHWTVRRNTFRNITSPSRAVAEHAVHFWDGSADDLVERNLIVNCDRGIGFGLGAKPNQNGVIRNNMIYHAAGIGVFADVGIALFDSPGSRVYNNTVILDSGYPRAIEYRFAATAGVLIANNLTNRAIAARDGATAVVENNLTHAAASWFVNAPAGDLHLAADIPGVVAAGRSISDLKDDFDGERRAVGAPPDIGADQRSRTNPDGVPGSRGAWRSAKGLRTAPTGSRTPAVGRPTPTVAWRTSGGTRAAR